MNKFKSVLIHFKETKNQLLLIVLLTFGVYANSLFNGLVWDDHLFLESWPQITSAQHLGEIFKGSAPPGQDKVYRPLRSLLYVVNYQLWGANPVFYHLQAVLLHLTVTVLVYFIAKALIARGPVSSFLPASARSKQKSLVGQQDQVELRAVGNPSRTATPHHQGSIVNGQLSVVKLLPFLVALLFGIHPIHTETISYISASMETWGSLFFFGSFWLYLRSVQSSTLRLRSGREFKVQSYIGSVVLATLAFFTYEMTLTLPILLILADQTLIRRRLKLISADSLGRYVPYFAAAGVFMVIRTSILGLVSRTDYLGYNFYLTMLVMVKVFVRYIVLLIAPFNQTAIHNLVGDFPSSMIPYDRLDPILNQTIFDLDVLLAITVIVASILIAIKCIRAYPIVTFGIGWFFITLLPVSYIIPHGGAMAEKYLYIPSFGVILGLVWAIARISPTSLKLRGVNADFVKQALVYVGVVVLLFYGISTVVRTRVWQDDITLFSDVARKSPNNLLANYTLGFWYGKMGNFEAAKNRYLIVIEKASEFWEARFNLANIYVRLGKFEAAGQEYENVLKVYPKNAAAKNILSNMPLLKESSPSAQIADELVVNYSTKTGLKFNFPASWSIEETKEVVVMKDVDSQLTVEIKEEKKLASQSFDDFIKSQKDSYGTLVNQGLAQIPNVQAAYVRVWSVSAGSDEKEITKLQFFLLGKDKVVKVLVYPADSPSMQTFDGILGSIKIE